MSPGILIVKEKIGKPNNSKFVGKGKPNGINKIGKIGWGLNMHEGDRFILGDRFIKAIIACFWILSVFTMFDVLYFLIIF